MKHIIQVGWLVGLAGRVVWSYCGGYYEFYYRILFGLVAWTLFDLNVLIAGWVEIEREINFGIIIIFLFLFTVWCKYVVLCTIHNAMWKVFVDWKMFNRSDLEYKKTHIWIDVNLGFSVWQQTASFTKLDFN